MIFGVPPCCRAMGILAADAGKRMAIVALRAALDAAEQVHAAEVRRSDGSHRIPLRMFLAFCRCCGRCWMVSRLDPRPALRMASDALRAVLCCAGARWVDHEGTSQGRTSARATQGARGEGNWRNGGGGKEHAVTSEIAVNPVVMGDRFGRKPDVLGGMAGVVGSLLSPRKSL